MVVNIWMGLTSLTKTCKLLLHDHKKDPQIVEEGDLEICGHMHRQFLDNFPTQQSTVTNQDTIFPFEAD